MQHFIFFSHGSTTTAASNTATASKVAAVKLSLGSALAFACMTCMTSSIRFCKHVSTNRNEKYLARRIGWVDVAPPRSHTQGGWTKMHVHWLLLTQPPLWLLQPLPPPLLLPRPWRRPLGGKHTPGRRFRPSLLLRCYGCRTFARLYVNAHLCLLLHLLRVLAACANLEPATSRPLHPHLHLQPYQHVCCDVLRCSHCHCSG